MSKSKMIVRTKFVDRACHWTVVICFFLVALSGISFFFPTLQWLTQTFGTPQMGRILHPFFGIAIFIALMFMFVRFVHHKCKAAEIQCNSLARIILINPRSIHKGG